MDRLCNLQRELYALSFSKSHTVVPTIQPYFHSQHLINTNSGVGNITHDIQFDNFGCESSGPSKFSVSSFGGIGNSLSDNCGTKCR